MWTRRNKLETGVNGNKKGRRIQSCTCLTSASSVRRSWSHPSHRQIVTVSPSSSAPGDPGRDPDVSVLIPSSSSSMCVSSCISNSCSSGGGLRDSDMVECSLARFKHAAQSAGRHEFRIQPLQSIKEAARDAIASLEMSPPESHPVCPTSHPLGTPFLCSRPLQSGLSANHTLQPPDRGARASRKIRLLGNVRSRIPYFLRG